MIRLTVHLVRSDLRSAPGRALAIAAMLIVAALLPIMTSAPEAAGAILAFAIAVAATVGTIAAYGRRRDVIAGNGGGRAFDALLSVATMVPPGGLAVAGALLVSALLSEGPSVAVIVGIALVLPVITAPVVALLAGRTASSTAGGAGPTRRASRPRRALGVVGWVLLAVLYPPLFLAWLSYRLTSPRRAWLNRVIGVTLAVGIVVGSTWIASGSDSWLTLSLVLLALGAPTAIAVAVLGTQLLELVGFVVGRIGPSARIALTPLTGRSRSLGPIVAILAVVTALAVMEPTMGASFEKREADRERTLPTVTARAGTSGNQAIGTVPSVDPARLRLEAARRANLTGARIALVNQLGVAAFDPGSNTILDWPIPSVHLGSTTSLGTPTWVGVVEPVDLAPLGLEASQGDLAAGKVLVLNPAVMNGDGTVTVTHLDGSSSLPTVDVATTAPGTLLPAGLVSPQVALALDEPVLTHRVVVTPSPDRSIPPEDLRAIASNLVDQAALLPEVKPEGLSSNDQMVYDLDQALAGSSSTSGSPVLGDEHVVVFTSGPLNDVPLFSGTRDEGRGRLFSLGALALLMTVASVGLALGATRREDSVLQVPGAPPSLRAKIAALQAGVVSGSASLLAVVVGIGIPALAFRQFDGGALAFRQTNRGPLPDIPLVVPGEVWILVIGLPIAAAVLTGLMSLITQRSAGPQVDPMDQLAW